ncbi:sigma factor regulator [Natranaerovirga hydrolytica]|uniref:Sigma factor regulator n=1 Tax=Natranaerovirga hydrolytica TaxID=680378 RepID=A0A4R1M7W7_9FIRM|nr:anti sigma factor C-terminal domain-containing protein [Natranaerovirga hydrolytica]TCK87877.1 sigma factor regulator [Natranaerovirga hydrolytica]
MNFKELIKKYKDNTATKEEIKIVEDEIEKLKLLNEYIDESFDLDLKSDLDLDSKTCEDNTQIINKIRKDIRKRNNKVILGSVAIVMLILITLQTIVSPYLNKLYYDPNETTINEYSKDLTILMDNYTRLHHAASVGSTISADNTGIGKYSLAVRRWNTFTGKIEYYYGNINKGILSIDDAFWSSIPLNVFVHGSYPSYEMSEERINREISKLKNAPSYTTVKAYLSFDEDLTMEELSGLSQDYRIAWVGIRNSQKHQQVLPLIGFEPSGTGFLFIENNEKYPYYTLALEANEKLTGEMYEKHFKSLLNFQIDHGDTLRNLNDRFIHKEYYEEVLSYVNEYGIKSYGIVIQDRPERILELIEIEEICGIHITDIQLSLPY